MNKLKFKRISKESLENDVKHNLREYCKLYGALYEPNATAIFKRAGWPDYTILHCSVVWFIECKRPTGKLSPAQEAVKKEILAHGGNHFVYNGLNDEELIRLFMSNKKNESWT